MIISIINQTQGLISDADVQQAIRAINRQLSEDFAPHWGLTATLRLEGNIGIPRPAPTVSSQQLVDMRGDAVIYLWHPVDVRKSIGYHAMNFMGIPYGFVFPKVSNTLREAWTVTLSHEALEMVVDSNANLFVMGPHPGNRTHPVFFWYEMCDAVQNEIYEIDGVPVSNFVLPLYFTEGNEAGSRNDFLNLSSIREPLTSFGVRPGGYAGFFDPSTGRHEVFIQEGDQIAHARRQIKGRLELTRRAKRYESRTASGLPVSDALRAYVDRVRV